MARGFTMIELLVVIAVVAILATLAMPSIQQRSIRVQVAEGRTLAQFAQQAIQAQYSASQAMPADNAAAGLPPADHIVGNVVTGLAVRNGAIVLTFGNQAIGGLAGHKLSLRPAVVDGYPQVPIAWVCGTANVPDKMTAAAPNETDLPAGWLPLGCRGSSH